MIVRERRWSSRHARSYAVGKLVAWEYKSKLGSEAESGVRELQR
jgi:hypothetical protein